MRTVLARVGLAAAAVALLATGSSAKMLGKHKHAAKPAAKAATCPVCHMALASKSSDKQSVAVKLTKKGKTMYCCSGCKMPASVLVKPKKGH